jgi:hypothetical protein
VCVCEAFHVGCAQGQQGALRDMGMGLRSATKSQLFTNM